MKIKKEIIVVCIMIMLIILLIPTKAKALVFPSDVFGRTAAQLRSYIYRDIYSSKPLRF